MDVETGQTLCNSCTYTDCTLVPRAWTVQRAGGFWPACGWCHALIFLLRAMHDAMFCSRHSKYIPRTTVIKGLRLPTQTPHRRWSCLGTVSDTVPSTQQGHMSPWQSTLLSGRNAIFSDVGGGTPNIVRFFMVFLSRTYSFLCNPWRQHAGGEVGVSVGTVTKKHNVNKGKNKYVCNFDMAVSKEETVGISSRKIKGDLQNFF